MLGYFRVITCVSLVTVLPGVVNAQPAGSSVPPGFETDQGAKPVDYGPGPGIPLEKAASAAMAASASPEALPAGTSSTTRGAFGSWVTWPIIPIHVVLLPDGRVLSYGSNASGQQGAQLIYDVWNPKQGTGTGSHLVLPNTTGTDIFCSGQSVLAGSGNVLLTGGDITIGGVRNYSDNATTIFYPNSTSSPTQAMRPDRPMAYKRWYSSIVPLSNGEKLVVGGRASPTTYAPTPEVYSASGGWRVLNGAASDAAFGSGIAWWYPRAYQVPNSAGKVFVLGHTGKMFYLTTAGGGSITQLAKTTLAAGYMLPTVMFAPGKLLSLRYNSKAIVIDISSAQPVVTTTADIDQTRYWSNATIMADGRILVSGGSSLANQLSGVAYTTQIWNPSTRSWTLGARATKPRLYHSTALLLPDGTVFTGGGGANGPVKNLNAEIYYPPYLYKGTRPTLTAAPATLSLKTRSFTAKVAAGNAITKVTLLHTGSSTHSTDSEQSFQTLGFTQSGQTLTINSPANRIYTLPGYYLLFVFTQNGAPSQAKIIKITA